MHLKMSSANAFNLNQFNFFSSGNGSKWFVNTEPDFSMQVVDSETSDRLNHTIYPSRNCFQSSYKFFKKKTKTDVKVR